MYEASSLHTSIHGSKFVCHTIKIQRLIYSSVFTLPQQVRVASELYTEIQRMKHSLDPVHHSASPSVQDIVTVALRRFLQDWDNAEKQSELLNDLLAQRKVARASMGRKKDTKIH
jgi:hypothetical protein